MSRRFLVVNADDLGYSDDINAAIEELHRLGVVTNASLMVDGPRAMEGAAIARRNPGLGVGLHLDLCPVLGFYDMPYQDMRRRLEQRETRTCVAAEVERQILAFRDLGLNFGHLDGHRHFHALPEIFETVVEVAVSHGLQTIRVTRDWLLPRTPSCYWSEEFFSSAADLLQRRHVRYADKFVYGWREYGADDFADGWNELMVHVGYEDEHYLREYRRLSSPEFGSLLRNAGVELTDYRALGESVL
jgi:predicted glycoside hydrolase/deacetylase ChbG (UPF0249 family)